MSNGAMRGVVTVTMGAALMGALVVGKEIIQLDKTQAAITALPSHNVCNLPSYARREMQDQEHALADQLGKGEAFIGLSVAVAVGIVGLSLRCLRKGAGPTR